MNNTFLGKYEGLDGWIDEWINEWMEKSENYDFWNCSSYHLGYNNVVIIFENL